MRLVVACLFVKGHVDFSADYVVKLRNMAERFAPEHDFVCATDRPKSLPASMETIPIEPPPRGMFAWWRKLDLFRASAFDGCRVLYLDLDTLIVAPLDAVAFFPGPFSLIPTAGSFFGKDGLSVVKRFNSSCMVWDGGFVNWLRDEWTPAVTKRLWGDQDWIGEQAPGSGTMPLEWFPRLSEIGAGGEIPAAAKVVLCKKPKNAEAARVFPWFRERWL